MHYIIYSLLLFFHKSLNFPARKTIFSVGLDSSVYTLLHILAERNKLHMAWGNLLPYTNTDSVCCIEIIVLLAHVV